MFDHARPNLINGLIIENGFNWNSKISDYTFKSYDFEY